jgi:hypothetical protein
VTGREFFDDHEATVLTAGAAVGRDRRMDRGPGTGEPIVVVFLGQQSSSEGDLVGADAVGEEAEVADADEALGQDVEQEASDELDAGEFHGLHARFCGAVLPSKADPFIVDVDDALVGDRNAVGVASEVLEDLGRAAEGGFGVDHPFLPAELGDRACPGLWIAKRLESAVELDLAVAVGFVECFEVQSPEEPAEHAHG